MYHSLSIYNRKGSHAWPVEGKAGVSLETNVSPHEFGTAPDFSEDRFVDKHSRVGENTIPDRAISEISLMTL